MSFRVNGDTRRWLSPAAAVCLLVFLANCGGGGGGGVSPLPPATELTINGTVTVPFGTPRSRSLTGEALPNATVRALLAFPPNTLITQSTTDADGRYTLTIPSEYVGRDLLIVAEKTVNNQRVRVTALIPSLPAQGYAGANLDAYTTLATEEILRYAREQNLNALSPNGVATVVDRVRDALRNRFSLSLVVGQTLPENIGDGLQDAELRNQVRPRVQEQAQNLRPPTGDVAVAKGMMQMLRDYGTAWLDRGNEETLRFEAAVRRQQQLIENEIATPLEALGERGVNFVVRILGLEERRGFLNPSIEGRPPGRYRETQPYPGGYVLERIGDTADNRTWIVESGQLTCTVTTANPLDEFTLSPDAGRISVSTRKQGDMRVQYDGVFEVTQRDSNGNATQIRVQITLTDGQLREPIRFNGTANTTPRNDGSFRTVSLSGNLQSQFAELTVTNLVYDTYPVSERVKQISAGRIQGVLKTERGPVIDLQNLNITFTDGNPPIENLQQFTLQSLNFSSENRTLVLRDVNAQFQRVGGALRPVRLQAYAEYRTPNDTLVGQVDARWENPTALDPLEANFIPINQFPRGNFEFNGNLTPRIGRRALVYCNIVSEPTLSPARVRTTLRIDFGDERMQGEFVGNLRVQSGLVERERLFQTATLQMTHAPSNFRMELSYSLDNDAASGVIRKPDGAEVARVGKANTLGLPDLGNAYLVRYTDGTFETVNSLLSLED
ncbi:MAG: carboxypeptidase-like regulatory domain-containing protein [Fimbriimonadales bacterium]|nr:carboxypeptidase-like regulatory domain-containing protein [Fimbriimonadales bacterium]